MLRELLPADDEKLVEDWHTALCVIGAVNVVALFVLLAKVDAKDGYGRWMKLLCVPWVVECAWRSVFVSLYLQRYVWYDSPLNAILVDRCLACVGELCWTVQISMALWRHSDGSRFVKGACVFAPLCYVFAEAASFYNVATTNERWAAMEVALDAIAVVPMAPAACYALSRGVARDSRASKLFLVVLALSVVGLGYFNFFKDVPMYLARYEADEKAGKTYFDFVPGLRDAAETRVVTRTYASWHEDMFWMTAYFTLACWSGLFLMFAPRPAHDPVFGKRRYVVLDARVEPLLPPESA